MIPKRARKMLLLPALLLSLSVALGAVGCMGSGSSTSDKLASEQAAEGSKGNSYKANFGGDVPNAGFGFLNDAPIIIDGALVSAENHVEINGPSGSATKLGNLSYRLYGAYDDKTGRLTATITVIQEDRDVNAEGKAMIRNKLTYDGLLTANKVSDTTFQGTATVTQSLTQTYTFSEYIGVGPGIAQDYSETKTNDLNWTFSCEKK